MLIWYKLVDDDWNDVTGGSNPVEASNSTTLQELKQIVKEECQLAISPQFMSVYTEKNGEILKSSSTVDSIEFSEDKPLLVKLPHKRQKILDGLGLLREIQSAVAAIFTLAVTSIGKTITLPDAVVWPCATNNCMFVRKYYSPLFEHILNRCRPKAQWKKNRYIVTGQPGVGKSVFAWYIIFRLLKDADRPTLRIIYLSRDLGNLAVIIEKSESGYSVSTVAADEILLHAGGFEEEGLVVISDTVVLPNLKCVMVWISSPGSLQLEEAKQAVNHVATPEICMPLTSLEEIMHMNATVFKDCNLKKEDVEARAAIWGPVPRLIFFKDEVESQKFEVEKIKALTPSTIEEAFAHIRGGAGDGKNPNHRLFLERAAGQDRAPDKNMKLHMQSYEFFLRGSPVIASQAMSAFIIGTMKRQRALSSADFIFCSAGIGEHGARRGTLFEEFALKAIAAGGTFRVRKLHPQKEARTEQDLILQVQKIVPWDRRWSIKTLESKAEDNTIIVPIVKNEAGLDALMWIPEFGHHVAVDFTVSERHGIHQEGLARNLAKFGRRGWTIGKGWIDTATTGDLTVQYFWIVPEDIFESWTHPQSAKSDSINAVGGHLVQYALRMPLANLFDSVSENSGMAELDAAFEKMKALSQSSGSQSTEGDKEAAAPSGEDLDPDDLNEDDYP